MNKKIFGTIIPIKLEKQFRETAISQGKQLNLALEEAMKLWLSQNSV